MPSKMKPPIASNGQCPVGTVHFMTESPGKAGGGSPCGPLGHPEIAHTLQSTKSLSMTDMPTAFRKFPLAKIYLNSCKILQLLVLNGFMREHWRKAMGT